MGKTATVVLGVVCCLLIAVCVILGVLLALSMREGPRVCHTSRCLADASRISSWMNQTVDPCANFYEFTCGNYPQDRIDNFVAMTKDMKELVRRLLENPIENDSANSTERKMKEYYLSCMESDVTEAEKLSALKEKIKKIGGFNPTVSPDDISLNDFNPSEFDIDVSLSYVHFNLSTEAFMRTSVTLQAIEKTDKLESYVIINGPLQEWCNDTFLRRSRSYHEGLRNASISRAMCFGADKNASLLYAQDVMSVTEFLCDASGLIEFENAESKRMTWDELLMEQPWLKNTKVDFFTLFEKPFHEWNHQPFMIDPSGMWAMKRLSLLYDKMDKRAMRNYVLDKFLTTRSDQLPRCLADTRFRSGYMGFLGEPKWRRCISDFVETVFPLGILSMLEKQMDPPIVKDEKLLTMVEEIRARILKRTLALPWLDDYLKERIKQRVEDKVVMIGGPKRVLDDSFVDRFYENLQINKSQPFLVNDINAKKFTKLVEAIVLRSPSIHYHMYINITDPTFVNAMNEVYLGGIVLFWSILRIPFYNYYSQEYLQYGSMGSIIGHEFGHDFDGYFTYQTWANRTEVPVLVESESCLQNTYMDIDFHGKEPSFSKNDTAYLGYISNQGIPDVMGLQWSFEAYRKHVSERGKEDDRLPGLPFTQEQLFFIARAQLWCNKRNWFMTLRVLGADSLNPYFPEVFNCPSDAPMNPENKCNLW